MYICICAAVTDRQIRNCIEEGCASVGELRAELGVCSGCGQCARAVRHMLQSDSSRENAQSVACSA